MATAEKKKDVYQDFLDVPPEKVAEILFGELHVSPRPSPKHANASSILGGDLSGPYHRGRGGPGGWWLLFEPEIHLGEHILVPDLGGWKKERLPNLPEKAYFDMAPDWVCEVISPSTARMDRVQKMPIYAEFGVSYLWLVDPDRKTLETFSLENQRWVLLKTFGGDEAAKAKPFDAVEIELKALWGEE